MKKSSYSSSPAPSQLPSVLACCFYGVSSGSVILALKATYSTYHIQQPTVIILIQQLFNLSIMLSLWIYIFLQGPSQNFLVLHGIKPPSFSVYHRRWVPLFIQSSVYLVSILFSQYALRQISIPLFSSWRRTTPLLILGLNCLRTSSEQPSARVWICLSLLAGGAFIVNASERTLDLIPVALVLLNNLSTVLHGWTVQDLKRYEIGPLTTNLANSINLSVLLLILSIVSGEMQTFLASGALNSLAIMGYITAASLSGVLISFALIMCSLVASPLATSVTGAVKDSVLNLAVYASEGTQPSVLAVVGSGLSIGGGLGFSLERLRGRGRGKEKEG